MSEGAGAMSEGAGAIGGPMSTGAPPSVGRPDEPRSASGDWAVSQPRSGPWGQPTRRAEPRRRFPLMNNAPGRVIHQWKA